MSARLRVLLTAVVATTAVSAAVANDATATTPTLTTGASAYSAAAGTGTATLHANLQLSGTLGNILDYIIGPIVTQDLNPIVAALQSTLTNTITSALGAASSLNASTSPGQAQYATAPAAFPNDTLPSPCVSSGAQPCYQGSATSANGAPLASLSVGAMTGYAEQVQAAADATNPVFARAGVASAQVSVLPGLSSLIPGLPSAVNPLVSASAVAAKANCPNDGSGGAKQPQTAPTASETASNVSLLGGLVTFGVLNGQLSTLVINGTSYATVVNLPHITVAGVTVDDYGSGLLIGIPLTVSQVFSALGLTTTVINALNGLTPTSSVTLSIFVGPNASVTATTATAWGLGIGVDLSGSLGFNLLNLVNATINIPSGISGSNIGNILDVKLGYATCLSGNNPNSGGGGGSSTPPIPPVLV